MCKPWRRELEARGFCGKTAQLCLALAKGGDAERLLALLRSNASSGVDAERALCLDGVTFLEKSGGGEGDMQEWLQAASQEPDASFLSRGAASTAQSLGLALVRWVDKPQRRYTGMRKLPGSCHKMHFITVALFRDGKRAVSGHAGVNLVKIWNAETGAEVSSLQ